MKKYTPNQEWNRKQLLEDDWPIVCTLVLMLQLLIRRE